MRAWESQKMELQPRSEAHMALSSSFSSLCLRIKVDSW